MQVPEKCKISKLLVGCGVEVKHVGVAIAPFKQWKQVNGYEQDFFNKLQRSKKFFVGTTKRMKKSLFAFFFPGKQLVSLLKMRTWT